MSGPRIPPGPHTAEVTAHALGTAKTGNQQIAVEFMFETGDRLTWFGYFTEVTLERTLESLENLGWIAGENDFDISRLHKTNVLVGNEASVVVQHEEYEGVTRAKIRWVNKLGGGGMRETMEPDEARSFAAQLRGRLVKASGGGLGKPSRSAPKRNAVPVERPADEDDIPL